MVIFIVIIGIIIYLFSLFKRSLRQQMDFKIVVVVLCVTTCYALSKVAPTTRPGTCPLPPQIYNCDKLTKCKDDYNPCKRWEKCCKSRCGKVCVDVRKKKQVAIVRAQKKGCPTPTWYGTCARLCSANKDCTCDETCCFNGCGYECVKKAKSLCKHGIHPTAKCWYGEPNNCPLGYTCSLQTNNYDIMGICCKNPPKWPVPDITPMLDNQSTDSTEGRETEDSKYNCRLVDCEPPSCTGAYLEQGECCAKCPICKQVVCPLVRCKNKFVPPGQCCPVCGPDCTRLLCPLRPLPCENPVVPKGQCCKQCSSCEGAVCPAVYCKHPEFPPGQCCPVCKQDCSKAICKLAPCPNAYTPKGECCPKCPDCKAVFCPAIFCKNPIYTPGQCCGDCRPGCSHALCEELRCQETYIPKGECCPKCKPDCSAVLCIALACPGSFTPEGECCPVCPGVCGYKDKIYKVGEQFADDCNTCTCLEDGDVSCTEKFCGPCVYNGVTYASGTEFMDKCNTCNCTATEVKCDENKCDQYCENGLKPLPRPDTNCLGIAGLTCPEGSKCDTSNIPAGTSDFFGLCCKDFRCPNLHAPFSKSYCGRNGPSCPNGFTCEYPQDEKTLYGYCCIDCRAVRCPEPQCRRENWIYLPTVCCPRCPGTCEYGGQTYNVGDSFPDDCNTCSCISAGEVVCTKINCAPCVYNGVTYASGTDFKDRCNTCKCSNADVSCTERDCGKELCETGLKPLPERNCLGFAGLRCPEGFKCDASNIPPNTADMFGLCCNDFKCQNGRTPSSKTHCDAKGLSCPRGFTCEYPLNEKTRFGFCCIDCRTAKCAPPPCKEKDWIYTETECCAKCPEPCVVNGVSYPNGAAFMKQCNKCTCTSGNAFCTKIGCLGCSTGLEPTPTKRPCVSSNDCPDGHECKFPQLITSLDTLTSLVRPAGTCCRTPVCKIQTNIALDFTYCTNGRQCPSGYVCEKFVNSPEYFGFCCPDKNVCVFDGKVYLPGQSYWADCNQCSCQAGGFPLCTLRACEPACYKEGKAYNKGQSVPHEDPCKSCICNEIKGKFSINCVMKLCAKLPCKDPVFDIDKCCGRCPEPCVVNGVSYPNGAAFMKQCNKCTCSNGNALCTKIGCLGCSTGLAPAPTKRPCVSSNECPDGHECTFPQRITSLDTLTSLARRPAGTCCRIPVCKIQTSVALDFTYCTNGRQCPTGYVCEKFVNSPKYLGFCCPDKNVCVSDGKVYLPGQSYWVDCNRCECRTNGFPICTLIACKPACYKEGIAYKKGQSVPHEDQCKRCICNEIKGKFSINCAMKICAKLPCKDPVFDIDKCCGRCPAGKPCEYDGVWYKDGESFYKECNKCTCFNGVAGCTKKGCLGEGCWFNGIVHKEGQLLESSAPCGKCVCVKKGKKYEIKCQNCCIEKGKFYEIADEVPRVKPCECCTCFNGPYYPEVKCTNLECAAAPCRSPIKLENTCCPVCPEKECYNIRDGQFYPIGARIPDDNPCTNCFCTTDGNIQCMTMDCLPLIGCRTIVTPPGQCCAVCADSRNAPDLPPVEPSK